VVADADGPLVDFLLGNEQRDDAPATLAGLRALGIEACIASGDRPDAVAACARRLGGLAHRDGESAADKLALVRDLQAQGHVVATVGDGVNEAPLLAGADVSVGIGGGTDLAKVSANIVLLSADLAPLVAVVGVARRTLAIVRQNLAWAILYNAAAVPLAATGMLTPWVASIGMSASLVLVVLNAARLLPGAPAHAPAARAPVALPAIGA
jgi:P-type Cu2+ transporter